MGIKAEMRRGLRTLERALDCPTCQWNNQAFVCVPSTIKQSKDLSRGGFAPQDSLVLKIRLELFGTGARPQLKDPVIYEGYTYSIQDINQPPGDAFISLVMDDPNRGA